MSTEVVQKDLASIASESDLADRGYDMVESWMKAGVNADALRPVLRFIETHPTWDLGSPGNLVHFVERFLGNGYEAELVASVHRMPTTHTLWMLNRLINGERNASQKARLLELMVATISAQGVSPEIADAAREFLSFQAKAN